MLNGDLRDPPAAATTYGHSWGQPVLPAQQVLFHLPPSNLQSGARLTEARRVGDGVQSRAGCCLSSDVSKSKGSTCQSQATRDPLEGTGPHTRVGSQSPEEPGERTQGTDSELRVLFLKGYKSILTSNSLRAWRVPISNRKQDPSYCGPRAVTVTHSDNDSPLPEDARSPTTRVRGTRVTSLLQAGCSSQAFTRGRLWMEIRCLCVVHAKAAYNM